MSYSNSKNMHGSHLQKHDAQKLERSWGDFQNADNLEKNGLIDAFTLPKINEDSMLLRLKQNKN